MAGTSRTSLADHLIKHDTRGYRNVQSGHLSQHWQTHDNVAVLPNETAEPAVFASENQGDRNSVVEIGPESIAFFIDTHHPDPFLLEMIERRRNISDANNGHMRDRAGGCFRNGCGQRRRMALGNNNAGNSASLR